MKKIFVWALILFLSGCAAIKTKNYSPPVWTELNDEYLNSFIGKDISEAQKMFGYKFSTNDLGNNRKAYIWEMDRQMGFGMSLIGSTKTVPCNWTFVTNLNGKILDSQRFGYCPSAIQIH